MKDSNNNIQHVSYQVKTSDTSWLSPSGYSQYYNRLTMAHEGKIAHSEVYGREQAIEHAKEYYETNDEYTESRRSNSVTIERVITQTCDTHKLEWKDGQTVITPIGYQTDLFSAKYILREGDLIWTSTGDYTIYLWDMEAGQGEAAEFGDLITSFEQFRSLVRENW